MWCVNVFKNKEVISVTTGHNTFAEAWNYKNTIEPTQKKKGHKVTITFEEMLDEKIGELNGNG